MFVVAVTAAFIVTTNDPAPGTTFFRIAVVSFDPTEQNTRLAAVTRLFVTVTVVPAAAMEQRPLGVFDAWLPGVPDESALVVPIFVSPMAEPPVMVAGLAEAARNPIAYSPSPVVADSVDPTAAAITDIDPSDPLPNTSTVFGKSRIPFANVAVD